MDVPSLIIEMIGTALLTLCVNINQGIGFFFFVLVFICAQASFAHFNAAVSFA
jgi:glycerol uptake facilitator-like aquaporin